MITFNFSTPRFDGKAYQEGYCLSTDTKPTDNIGNGSILAEIDTGDVYFFNETAGAWVKQFSFQS